MVKRIAAIAFIFFCTSIAWMILGGTISARTNDLSGKLKSSVGSTWGTPQNQLPPSASFTVTKHVKIDREQFGKTVSDFVDTTSNVALPLESSDIHVNFELHHRQKGLLWYSTYGVQFAGAYTFTNTSTGDEQVTIQFPFPAGKAVYDDFHVTVDGVPVATAITNAGAATSLHMQPGQVVHYSVGYKSQGMDNWWYRFGDDVTQIRNFSLVMTTNFDAIDFPDNSLSPTDKKRIAGGWELTWRYSNLLSGFQIAMVMPEKLQPGPLAGQISFFAPVSLFFFFFIMFIITTIRGIELHPMNYFFLAAAFFSFHLLMAYLVDHISIHLAFIICSVVSIFLVVSYLRLVLGLRFAALEAGISQFIYLVLFSYAFFFKGFTGLSITIGSIVTLFVVMQMTGRIRWSEKFDKKPEIPVTR